MKPFAVIVAASALLCVASAQSLRSQIEAANKTTHKLMMAKDVKGLTKEWKGAATADFKYVDAGRTMNMDQMCQGMAMGLGQMKKLLKADSKILSVKEKGNTGTSTTDHIMEGVTVGPDKKPHTMTFKGVSTETYVKQGGKWKMSKMAWGKQTMLMDGKPMPTGR
jgi:hypothetical protein